LVSNQQLIKAVPGHRTPRSRPIGSLVFPSSNSALDSTIQIKGPFPKYLRFDWLGRSVDAHGEVVTAALVTFTTPRGTSIVKVDSSSKPQVVYGEEQ